ncbi:MAG: ArgR family transcriptional regulator [Planctomycetota bacterium]
MDTQRQARLEALRQILETQGAATQAALVQSLAALGHRVTQSSVSRDLRELGAVRGPGGYALPGVAGDGPRPAADLEILRTLVLDVQPAGPNMLVVRTVIGGASRVGLVADRAGWPELVGTVAGDDTLFRATRSLADRRRLEQVLAQRLSA